MKIDLDDLEATAKAATPGPWSINWETDEYHAGMPDKWALSINGPEASDFADLAAADAEHIAAFDPPTVLALIAKLREAEAKMPPCDGGCSYGIGPEETCSAHGRPPAEIWGIVASVAAERDAVQGQLGEAEAVIETVRAEQRDYSIPHDEALSNMGTVLATYKPTNQEGES